VGGEWIRTLSGLHDSLIASGKHQLVAKKEVIPSTSTFT
jgi:hypothetical protein